MGDLRVTTSELNALTQGASDLRVTAVEPSVIFRGASELRSTAVEVAVLVKLNADRPSYQLLVGPAYTGTPQPYEPPGIIDYFNVYSTCEVCLCPDYQPEQPPMPGLTQPSDLPPPPSSGF